MPTPFADVSVIVAAYQAAGTIARTLTSIAGQTLLPREVVVADDGSTDGTADTAKACAARMNGIELRVVRTDDNRGAGAARNLAIARSTQPILAFLDADDEWLPEKLARSLAVLENGKYDLVAHDYWTGEGADTQHHDCARRFEDGPDPFVALYRKGYIPSCSVVARRAAVLSVGGFDPTLRNAQDFDLWLAMLRNTEARFCVFAEPLLRYHLTPGGIMSHTARRLQCGMTIARRYYPDLKNRPGSALLSLWYRVSALHKEAIAAYPKQGRPGSALFMLVVLPVRLMSETLKCLAGRPETRPRPLDSETVINNE